MCCNIELLGTQLYCNEVGWKGLVSVTIHLLYRGSGVQFGPAVGKGHCVTIQLLYCDVVFFFRWNCIVG